MRVPTLQYLFREVLTWQTLLLASGSGLIEVGLSCDKQVPVMVMLMQMFIGSLVQVEIYPGEFTSNMMTPMFIDSQTVTALLFMQSFMCINSLPVRVTQRMKCSRNELTPLNRIWRSVSNAVTRLYRAQTATE